MLAAMKSVSAERSSQIEALPWLVGMTTWGAPQAALSTCPSAGGGVATVRRWSVSGVAGVPEAAVWRRSPTAWSRR